MSNQPDTSTVGNASHASDFVLGDWVVQPSLNRASRDGSVIHLRPQLMDVLVCLAQRAGQTVSRDTLMDGVWPNQFVADTALARCVAELRQAFGDSAQTPSIIETIPKRGYRVIAPVGPVPGAGGGNGNGHGAVAATVLPAALLAGASAPEEEALPVVSDSDAGTAVVAAAPTRTGWRRRALVAVNAVLVLAGVALLGSYVVNWIQRAPPPLTDQDSIVLSFVNATGDPAFDDTLRLALAIHLEQSPFLRLTPVRRVREALQLMGQPADAVVTPDLAQQVCERLGARAVLQGSIAALGRQYVIGLEASACSTRETVARAQVEAANKEGVLAALSQAANTMRERLGESLASIRRFDVPLVLATTPSLEALRAVSLGDRERDRGHFDEALIAYRDAVGRDPNFAIAYARMGVTLLSLQRRGEAAAPLRRAHELRDRVTLNERLYIAGHYFNNVLQDPLHAVDAFASWRQSHPRSVEARIHLASVYARIGLWTLAVEEAREAVTQEPDNAIAIVVLAHALSGADRPQEAIEILRDAGRRGIHSPNIHDLRFDIAFVLGDAAIMREENTYAARDPAMEPFIVTRRARLAMARGQFVASRTLWAQVRATAEARQDVPRAAAAWLAEAGSLALLGDRGRALSAVGEALAMNRSPTRLAQAALVLALAGDASTARRYLAEYDLMAGLTSGRDPEFVRPAQAAIAIVEGRYAEVAGLLEPIAPYELGTGFEYLPTFIRARALMKLGRTQDAAAAYQTIIDHRGVSPLSLFHPLAWLGRARAYAALGNPAEGRRSYDVFFRLWQDADRDSPVLVTAQAEFRRLART